MGPGRPLCAPSQQHQQNQNQNQGQDGKSWYSGDASASERQGPWFAKRMGLWRQGKHEARQSGAVDEGDGEDTEQEEEKELTMRRRALRVEWVSSADLGDSAGPQWCLLGAGVEEIKVLLISEAQHTRPAGLDTGGPGCVERRRVERGAETMQYEEDGITTAIMTTKSKTKSRSGSGSQG
ncbi:hypothetical protein J7T55_008128 [Diaporthe amygdali]|uniref:uncharacterized protein n=1 Tax=Phomopsis amygdali TaxID=1214568 RepID=UPI0022FE2CA4|nr:uncharacterized protein J7T55_008128 [Diaporthe amygdali]KAJ0107992.1 hypothetical protein J7T55_008128 [Diaporthe amygdali]